MLPITSPDAQRPLPDRSSLDALRVKDAYLLKRDMLAKARQNMKILHPLPRVNEIEYSIDDTPYAYYFQQARNGLYARQALICDSLGITLEEVKNDKTIIA